MVKSLTRSHILVLPLVLLVIILVEEIAEYQMRIHVSDVHLRTLAVMLLYGPGFAFLASKLSPLIKKLLLRVRQSSRRGAGTLGVWTFFFATYGLLFYAYLQLETQGPTGLMPPSWSS